MPTSAQKARQDLHRHFKGSSKRVRVHNGLVTRILLIVHNQLSTSKRRNGNRNCSKWLSLRFVGLCDGMVLLLAERALQDGPMNIFGEQIDGLLTPLGSKVRYQPISSKDEARLHNFGKKVLPRILMGYALRAGGGRSGDLLIADCEDHENLSASDVHVTRFRHQEVAQGKVVISMCRRISLKLFDLLNSTRRNARQGKHDQVKKMPFFRKRNRQT